MFFGLSLFKYYSKILYLLSCQKCMENNLVIQITENTNPFKNFNICNFKYIINILFKRMQAKIVLLILTTLFIINSAVLPIPLPR